MLDDWRLIPNWIIPWFEGPLRPSDLFHDHHPSLGMHLLYVANASWFGFQQKLLDVAGLTAGVGLAALLALWWNWASRFPAVEDPDWRVVVLEKSLRFVRSHDLAGLAETPDDCAGPREKTSR
jgi:hypothetical protein